MPYWNIAEFMSTETDAVSNEAGMPLLNVAKRHRGYELPSDLYIIKQRKLMYMWSLR